ncbi:MAG TPA: SDR family oxidoreductase [Micrococcaceae bacterium]
MANLAELAVTGSTGHVGGALARLLAGAGTPQRLLVRDATRAPALEGAVPLLSSYADKSLALSALAGVRTLFMVSAAEAEDRLRQHLTFVDAAAEAGVEHIVYTSFFGAAPDATFTLARDHYATEERIRASGMAFTFLRDNLYTDFLPLFVGDDGVLRGPAADGAAASVTRADVARCALAILADTAPHAGASYDLTGPEDLTLSQAVAIIAAETGRTVSYHAETIEEAYASRARYGAPRWQLEAWVSTYTAIAAGELSGPTTAVRDLTGAAPLSLRDFLRQG